MTVVSVFFALLFGGIAIWAGIGLINAMRRPGSQSQGVAPSVADAWGEGRMRRRERDPQ